MINNICFVILSSANYNSIKSVILNTKKEKKFKVSVVLGASAINEKYGYTEKLLKKDKIKIDFRVDSLFLSNEPSSMARTTGETIIQLSIIFNKIKPDIVFTVGDRHETLGIPIAASYLNIPVAHTMGGEVTGSIDENVRHAVTKLSHLHFVANKDSKKRVIRLGELKQNIFNVGCPRIDSIKEIIGKNNSKQILKKVSNSGLGDYKQIKKTDKYFVILVHPVTTEFNKQKINFLKVMEAVYKFKNKKIIIWPNADAGSDIISKQIRIMKENNKLKDTKIIKNLPLEDYINLINNCGCLIGNTSSGIRDSAYLGVPVVNIGSRQNKRLRGKNVVDCSYEIKDIVKKISYQLTKKRYRGSFIYGDGNASKKIISILKRIKFLNIQKLISY